MRKLYGFVVFIATFFYSAYAHANHLLGGEIGYSFISSNGINSVYKVRLMLLGDCSSESEAFEALTGANPLIKIFNGSNLVASQNLVMIGDGTDITPLCPDEAENNACHDLNSPYPGIKQFIYEGDITINGTSNNWKFVFDGRVSDGTYAGRSGIIQNADILGGSSLMYLFATLNNTSSGNSTPVFTSLPSPFFCVNTQQNYNLGCVDPNGDILNYSLEPALQIDGSNPQSAPVNITYYSPYTATTPIPTSDFNFNSISGQMTFTANQATNCIVVNRATETRNGVVVGTSMREMIFVILPDCNNVPPADTVRNIGGASVEVVNNENTYQACYGQSQSISFDIASQDPNGDNINITYSNLPNGSSINIDNNGTPNPIAHFVCDLSAIAPGNYTFYITYTDDGCPLSSNQTIGYTISIVPLGDDFTITGLPPCDGMSNGSIIIQPVGNAGKTYNYIWLDENETIISQKQNSNNGDTLSNLSSGNYTVKVSDEYGCTRIYDYSLSRDEIIVAADDTSLCPGDVVTYTLHAIGSTAHWEWDFGDGKPRIVNENVVEYQYQTPGNYLTTLYTSYPNNCLDTFEINIIVHPNPDVNIIVAKTQDHGFCVGDTVILTGSGADIYNWTSNLNTDIVTRDTFGFYLYDFYGTVTMIGIDTNTCIDSAAITLTGEPCCTLLMPNAFSPNGDGINDWFGPSTFGHPKDYQFQIYNRWGEKIFVSFRVEDKWNGNFKGKPAEASTYYYLLNGVCANGEKIHQQGDFILMK